MTEEVDDYIAATPRSRELQREAARYLLGGSSRAVAYFEPYPFFVDHAQGHYVHDVDGNRYLDFMINATTYIVGHANPLVVKAVQQQAARGLSYAQPTEAQVRLAKILCDRVPSVDTIRFTNSGTEGTLNAIRLARAYTWEAQDRKVRGRLSRKPRVRLNQRQPSVRQAGSRRPHGHPRVARPAAQCPERRGSAPIQRPGDDRVHRPPAPGRPVLHHHGAGLLQFWLRARIAEVPAGHQGPDDGAWYRPHLRRGAELPAVRRGSPGEFRRDTRHHHLRQDHRRRHACWGVGKPRRLDGAVRPDKRARDLPRRDLQRQSL